MAQVGDPTNFNLRTSQAYPSPVRGLETPVWAGFASGTGDGVLSEARA
jgi:hypothetical protein